MNYVVQDPYTPNKELNHLRMYVPREEFVFSEAPRDAMQMSQLTIMNMTMTMGTKNMKT